jgi:DNA-binding transcriptional MerR regulator
MSIGASERAGASHLSIGEVLSLLRDEFPDITISKIRFLESQGLIDPERTPSGYRKFYEADVARLRWILHQQKEHFLPLKVIKERLEHLDAPGAEAAESLSSITQLERPGDRASTGRVSAAPAQSDSSSSSTRPAASKRARRPEPRRETPRARPDTEAPGRADAKDRFTRTDLAATSGLEERELEQLESYGLVAPVTGTGSEKLFDEESLAIAQAAAGFFRHGIEARHLRMYKHFAEREAALFEQVLVPYLRQRNPEARAKARDELTELIRLGRSLRAALLVHAVRDAMRE